MCTADISQMPEAMCTADISQMPSFVVVQCPSPPLLHQPLRAISRYAHPTVELLPYHRSPPQPYLVVVNNKKFEEAQSTDKRRLATRPTGILP